MRLRKILSFECCAMNMKENLLTFYCFMVMQYHHFEYSREQTFEVLLCCISLLETCKIYEYNQYVMISREFILSSRNMPEK